MKDMSYEALEQYAKGLEDGLQRFAQAMQIGVMEEARLRAEVQQLKAFRKEWSDRFGFLATKNPRDSFASIDEVASILTERDDSE